MGQNSKIEWTHHTFNPWWGCVKVSPACDHCYAESFAKRTGNDVWGKDAPRRFCSAAHWQEPLKWNREAEKTGERRRVFCASMADVMEERLELAGERERLYALIAMTPHLDWLLLTKRPQNYRRFLPEDWLKEPRKNLWLGTTLESPDYLWRVDAVKTAPAAVHFLSVEPLLADLPTLGEHLDGIDWVICGGESGHGARPMHPDWARSVRDQCQATGVAFHFKQWGEYVEFRQSGLIDFPPKFPTVEVDQHTMPRQCTRITLVRIGKKTAGRMLDGRTWDEFPEAGW